MTQYNVKLTHLYLWEKTVHAKTPEEAIEKAERQSNSWAKSKWTHGDESAPAIALEFCAECGEEESETSGMIHAEGCSENK